MTSAISPFNRTCPACHGYGGKTDVILDDGTGPWEPCGFCDSHGKITNKNLYYQVLGWLSALKRFEKRSLQHAIH